MGPGAIPKGPIKDTLSGVPIGHAAHPLLIVLPVGTWTSATLLDLVGGPDSRPAARRLIAAGLLASLPAAATGLNDWADTTPASDSVRRVGAVHALANVTALGLFTASLAARRGGSHGRGVALGLAGMGAVSVGGHLGGHLSYAEGVGVDQTVFEAGPEGGRTCWTTARWGRASCAASRSTAARSCSRAATAGCTRSRTAARTAGARWRTASSRASASSARCTRASSGSRTAPSSAARPPTRSPCWTCG